MDPHQEIHHLTDPILQGTRPPERVLHRLIELARLAPHELFHAAHRVRCARFGRRVRLCSIVPGKLDGCSEDCQWCAQSARHALAEAAPKRTRMPDILAAAHAAGDNQAASIGIVNSGRRPTETDLRQAVEAARRIRQETGRPVAVCASLGELTPDQARRLVAAGFVRYNHNLETSRRMYGRLVTTHAYDDRLATLQAAREAGLSLCCGGIFGLGETWDDRLELAMTLREQVRPDVVPLNFLHPIPGTPLAGAQPLAPREILTIIAVFRLAMPEVDLKIAGGREANLRDLQSWMFHVGGTSCIVGNYLATRGRSAADDLRMIADLGLEIVSDLAPTDAPAGDPS